MNRNCSFCGRSDHFARSCRYRKRTDKKRSTHERSGPGPAVSDQPPHHTLIETGTSSQKYVAASEIRRYQRRAINSGAEPRPEVTLAADGHLTRALSPRGFPSA
ncbi:hypothetical protein RRG08_045853 [Elysia crispata]|uniref:Uncharacterized protein n=1 Tax=Elysia crispata TaxID=231223 RepID=A0AAE1B282_9GAST|nr:hypothetical protein RRG08_045853 [Elysia crispata]